MAASQPAVIGLITSRYAILDKNLLINRAVIPFPVKSHRVTPRTLDFSLFFDNIHHTHSPGGPLMPRRYQRQAARRKPNSSPITQFILGFVPVYPGMMHIDQVRKAIQFHSDPRLRLSTASEPASLHARFSTLVKRERLIRTAFGFYARPGQRSDLELHDRWRPKKRMPKPTLSQELRTANAMLR